MSYTIPFYDEFYDSYSDTNLKNSVSEICEHIRQSTVPDMTFREFVELSENEISNAIVTLRGGSPILMDTYYANEIKNEATNIINDCSLYEVKQEIFVDTFRSEMKQGLNTFIQTMINNGTITSFYNLATPTVTVAKIQTDLTSLACSHLFMHNIGAWIINDARQFLSTHVYNYEFYAQLKDTSNNELKGFPMTLYNGETYYGAAITDEQGYFSIPYFVDDDGVNAAPTELNLTLNILDSDGNITDAVPINNFAVGNAKIQVLDAASTTNPDLADASCTLTVLVTARGDVSYDTELTTWLGNQSPIINNLSGIRAIGGLKYSDFKEGDRTPEQEADIAELDALAQLDTIYYGGTINNAKRIYGLYKDGETINYTSVADIAKRPRREFVQDSRALIQATPGNFTAAKKYIAAKVQDNIATNVLNGAIIDLRNNYSSSRSYGDSYSSEIHDKLKLIYGEKCNCEDCEAAISPLAYLLDLVNYITSFVKDDQGGGVINNVDWQDLELYFKQQFSNLAGSCESLEEIVCQVRIAIEILHRYEGSTSAFQSDIDKLCFVIYKSILLGFSINYSDLENMKSVTDEDVRKEYADSIGIYYEEGVVDSLSKLLLTEDNTIENKLEEIYGLVDTIRDPLNSCIKITDDNDLIPNWKFKGVKYDKNTNEEGYVYINVTGSGSGPYTVQVYENYNDPTFSDLVASGTGSGSSTFKITLKEENLSGLYGYVYLDPNVTYTGDEVQFSLIPVHLCYQLRFIKKQWFNLDHNLSTDERPIIDPDILVPNDFVNPYELGTTPINTPIELWDERKTELAAKYTEIKQKRDDDDKTLKIADRESISLSTGVTKISDKVYLMVDDVGVTTLLECDDDGAGFTDVGTPPSVNSGKLSTDSNDNLYHANELTVQQLKITDATENWAIDDGIYDLTTPVDVDFDADDNMFILDKGANKVVRLTPATEFIKGDHCLFDAAENYYVVENAKARVRKFDKEGNVLQSYGYNVDVDLRAKWKFDQNLNDTSGYGTVHNLLSGTTPAYFEGKIDEAVGANGTTDYFYLTNLNQGGINDDTITERSVQVWFNAADVNVSAKKQLLYKEGTKDRGIVIYIENGTLYGGAWTTDGSAQNVWPSTFLSTSKINSGTWHNVILTLNGSKDLKPNALKLYLDGELQEAGVGMQIYDPSGKDLCLAALTDETKFADGNHVATSTDCFFKGSLDETIIWERELTATEAALQYSLDFPSGNEGELTSPNKVYVDSLSNVLVLESSEAKVIKFSSAGIYETYIDLQASPAHTVTDIAENIAGNYVLIDNVSSSSTSELQIYTNSGSYIETITEVQTDTTPISINELNSLIVDANGNYILSDYGASQLIICDSSFLNGVNISNWPETSPTDSFSEPKSLLLYEDFLNEEKILYIDDSGNDRLLKFEYANDPSFEITFKELWSRVNTITTSKANPLFDLSSFNYITIDSNGYLYGSDSGKIYNLRFPYTWGQAGYASHTDLYNPEAISVDMTKSLVYVANTGSDNIKIYDLNGGVVNVVKTVIGSEGNSSYEFSAPNEVYIDNSSNIYINDSGNTRILKYSPDWALLNKWSKTDVGYNAPKAFYVDSNRKLWMADTDDGTAPYYGGFMFDTMQMLGKVTTYVLSSTLDDLLSIYRKENDGENIDDDLSVFPLSMKEYRFLINLILKAESEVSFDSSLENEEITSLYNLFVNVYKWNQFKTWKTEEENLEIVLGPDHFKLEKQKYTTENITYVDWRSSYKLRKEWETKLKARITQLENLINGHPSVIEEAEKQYLPAYRTILIDNSDAVGTTTVDKAKYLQERLLVDFQMECCQKISRVTQALESLQLFLWGVRTKQFENYSTLQNVYIDSDKFDEEWKWMGSYATWRAAAFVFMYPENLLDPTLRKYQTPLFKKITKNVRENASFSPQAACNLAGEYKDYLEDVADMSLVGSCKAMATVRSVIKCDEISSQHQMYITFGVGNKTHKVYYITEFADSKLDEPNNFWIEVPNVQNVTKFLGCKPTKINKEDFIYVFFTKIQNSKLKVFFIRYDLERAAWDEEPTELSDPPVESDIFEIVMVHDDSSYWLPGFVIVDNKNQYDEVTFYNSNGSNKTVDRKGPIMFSYIMNINGQDWGDWGRLDPQAFERASYIKLFTAKRVTAKEQSDVPDTTYIIGERGYAEFDGQEIIESAIVERKIWKSIPQFNGQKAYFKDATDYLVDKKNVEVISTFGFCDQDSSQNYINYLYCCEKNTITNRVNIKLYRDNGTKLTEEVCKVKNNNIQNFIVPDSFQNDLDINAAKVYIELVKNQRAKKFAFKLKTKEGVFSKKVKFIDNAVDDVKIENINQSIYRITPNLSVLKLFSTDKSKIQERRLKLKIAYRKNITNNPELLTYIKEAYYFLPVLFGAELQNSKYYLEALDWYRLVYDYAQDENDKRKVFYGLIREESFTSGYNRSEDWFRDPLNPHAIAGNRPNTYTRFTLMSIVKCLLEYADSEFTKDNVESVAKARELYETALKILADEGLTNSQEEACQLIIDTLTPPTSQTDWSEWETVWNDIVIDIYKIKSKTVLSSIVSSINSLSVVTTYEWLEQARILVDNALADQYGSIKKVKDVLTVELANNADAKLVINVDASIPQINQSFNNKAEEEFASILHSKTSVDVDALEGITNEFSWLGDKTYFPPVDLDTNVSVSAFVGSLVTNDVLAAELDPSYVSIDAPSSDFSITATYEAEMWSVQNSLNIASLYIPQFQYSFCVPKNPVLNSLILNAEINLFKLRNCMNISGMKRTLSSFAAATDTTTGLPSIGAGGTLSLPGLQTQLPTLYRYDYLIDRAKQMTSMAQQIESSFLSALEKLDAENYSEMKAKQDIEMSNSSLKLQRLRVKEAEHGVDLAELQLMKVVFIEEHYKYLLSFPLNALEILSLATLQTSSAVGFINAAANFSTGVGYAASVALAYKAPDYLLAGQSALSGALSTQASVFSAMASYKRRAEEWKFQRDLAEKDIDIADQQISLAKDRVKIVGQEYKIAEMQKDQAYETLDFLRNKFTNADLYAFMSRTLENIYAYFLKQATAMAKLAAVQLSFEKQADASTLIKDDYWLAPSNTFGSQGKDFRGMTGSARLLKDLTALDQFAFELEKDKRKFQLKKTISLATNYPMEFRQLVENGQMTFETKQQMFDYDFPGHYCRLIKRVKLSVLALVPPMQGVKATLLNTGNSVAVVNSNYLFSSVPIRKLPESIAFTTPQGATGLFEMQQMENEKLYPFEGSGVETNWQLTMSKSNNFFDFNTIADIIVEIEYTSFEDFTYKQQVLKELDSEVHFNRSFSFKNHFADQWYDLNHADEVTNPYEVEFDISSYDFPANISDVEIENITMYFSSSKLDENGDPKQIALNAKLVINTDIDGSIPVVIVDKFANAKTNAIAQWGALIGQSPVNTWTLKLENSTISELSNGDTVDTVEDLFKNEEIDDIFFVISYKGGTYKHPDEV